MTIVNVGFQRTKRNVMAHVRTIGIKTYFLADVCVLDARKQTDALAAHE